MWAYWLMFAFPALLAVTWREKLRSEQAAVWFVLTIILVIFIGFRHKVGGDWESYKFIYEHASRVPFYKAILVSDPGYALLNWVSAKLGYGIYAVNLVCGIVFVFGLVVFARLQSNPWIAIAVAFPYIVTVVAMGYSRQGVALGFLLLAIVSLEKNKFTHYLVYIVAATLFHKTALLMIPLGLFIYGKGRIIRVLAITITAYGLWDLLLSGETERLWKSYIEEQMVSDGAKIRVWMNFVPAAILLFYHKKWKRLFSNYTFWVWLSFGSMAGVILVDFASTAVDRISLYLTPVQIAVFSRLPYMLKNKIRVQDLTLIIIGGYALVLFVWLSYATHARYWLPYDNLIFQ